MDGLCLDPGAPFFSRPSFFLAAFGIYAFTLAPSISWKNNGSDSGDLTAAAFTGGVAHPPGYPVYVTLAALFVRLPVGSVAYRVNLFSAVAAASAVVALYVFLLLLPHSFLQHGIAGASALFFAFSPLFWSQATIAEVYTLNALFLVLGLGGFLLWAGETNLSNRKKGGAASLMKEIRFQVKGVGAFLPPLKQQVFRA